MASRLQEKAFFLQFHSFPLVPPLPFGFKRKTKELFYDQSKFKNGFYLLWLLYFDLYVGVVQPGYLIYLEFLSSEAHKYDFGMKSIYHVVFLVAAIGCSAPCVIIILNGRDVCKDLMKVLNLQKKLDAVYEEELNFDEKTRKRKLVDTIGVLTVFTVQGYSFVGMFIPAFVILYGMEPGKAYFQHVTQPFIEQYVNLSPESLKVVEVSVRLIWGYGLIQDGCRNLSFTILIAWVGFEALNQCSDLLSKISSGRATKLYWVFWKTYAGLRYWSKWVIATGLYVTLWIVITCAFATIHYLPRVKRITLAFLIFPLGAAVGTCAFLSLPFGVKFPSISRSFIGTWRRSLSKLKVLNWKAKILRREVKAMQPVLLYVGEAKPLDRDAIKDFTSMVVDKTVDLVLTFE